MHIGIVNVSTVVPQSEIQPYVDAQVHQLRYDLCPGWGISTPSMAVYARPKDVPLHAQVVVIYDTSDQQGALAYHTEDQNGLVFSRVFAKTLKDNGVSWTSGASHEVCEMTVDPNVNLSADDGNGNQYAWEICDPVESDGYMIGTVQVSDFVYRAWFDPSAPAGTRTRKGTSKGFPNLAPFTLAAGGYAIKNGKAVFGEAYPAWRGEMKGAGSRTARRIST